MNCLAAVFTGPGQPLQLQQLPRPDLQPGEVLVRVTCCTLCGSDVHTYLGHRPASTPTVLGHETVGQVLALPPGDPVTDHDGKGLTVGQRVTWAVVSNCGQCFYCQNQLPQKCQRGIKYGHQPIGDHYQLTGGLAELCHLAAGSAIFPVPETLPDTVACPASCATATVAAALRVAGGCRDQVVLIQGAGMLGLTAAAMCRVEGARETILCDIDPTRLELASPFGATQSMLVNESSDPLKRWVDDKTAGRGVDLALELSGASSAIEWGFERLRVGGRYVLVGTVSPGPAVSFAPESLVRRQITIQGVHNYAPQDLKFALAFLDASRHVYPWADLVRGTFSLSEADAAFQHQIASRAPRVAVMPTDRASADA